MSMLRPALAYAKSGIPIFPCRPDKRPYTQHGFKDASQDESQIRAWAQEWPDALIGMPTGALTQTVVIDVDVKGSKSGYDALLELQKKHGRLPDTRIVKTPSGGWHYAFNHPGEAVRSGVDVLGEGLDIRADGGYVIAPPSAGYEVIKDVPPADMPAWLVALLRKDAPAGPRSNGSGQIQEGGRNAHLASVGGFLRRRGLSEEQIAVTLHATNETACVPPLPASEVASIARSVSNYAPAERIDEPPSELYVGKSLLQAPLHVRWNGPPPAREWLLDGWIPAKKVAALYGDGGAGKTLVVMQLGTCAAIGRDLFGIPTAQGRTLGFLCEDGDDELWRRQADINEAYGITMADLGDRTHWISREGEDNLLCTFDPSGKVILTDFYRDVNVTAQEFRPDTIVIDTSADTYGGNDLSTPQVRQFIKYVLGGLARRHNCTVLLLAHPSMSGKLSGEGTHGSVQWNNAVRSRLYLERKIDKDGESNGERVLSTKKSNYGPDDKTVKLFWDRGAYWPVLETGSAEQERKSNHDSAFMQCLAYCEQKGIEVSPASNSPSKYFGNLFPETWKEMDGRHATITKRQFELAYIRIKIAGKTEEWAPNRDRKGWRIRTKKPA